ncbi:MAG: NTP transferase domain-containing protein [Erythrobacter sp.]
MTSALVLAGTRPGGDPLAGAEGKPHKALIEIEGRPLLERVVSALHAAGIERIGVSCDEGPVADLARKCGCEVLRTGAGPSESASIGFAALGAPLVITTADHALLQPDWVRTLIEGTPGDSDLGVGLARREDVEAAMPGSRRTYLRLADGAWSGCNLFYLRTPAAEAALSTWRGVEADRKRPWRIAGRLGLGTLLSYAFGRLTLADAISRLGKRMRVEARLVRLHDGLAAVDVDKPQDLDDIRAILSRKPRSR